MPKFLLDLTVSETEALEVVLDDARHRQGDGSLPDYLDDALVSLNDKIEAELLKLDEDNPMAR